MAFQLQRAAMQLRKLFGQWQVQSRALIVGDQPVFHLTEGFERGRDVFLAHAHAGVANRYRDVRRAAVRDQC